MIPPGNGLKDQDAPHLAPLFTKTYRLKYLNLRHNDFGEKGGIELGQHLEESTSLVEVDLRYRPSPWDTEIAAHDSSSFVEVDGSVIFQRGGLVSAVRYSPHVPGEHVNVFEQLESYLWEWGDRYCQLAQRQRTARDP